MISNKGVKLITQFEGLKLVAYLDSAGIWTIGYGTIVYPSGIKVKKGDKCTIKQAEEYFTHDLERFEDAVDDLVKSNINQNQYDSLVSLAYNIGIGAFSNSTLLKKVNKNPNDKSIASEFLKWDKVTVNGVKKSISGLTYRRQKEYQNYFS